MTSGSAGSGDGWAKTVVDGIPEGGSETEVPSGAPGPEAVTETADDEVVEAELMDDEATGAESAGDPDADVEGDADGEAAAGSAEAEPVEAIEVEDLVADLERVSAERDQYLDASRRIQAEFENYKKQVSKREADARERANDSLIGELLPVLDAFDGALANGADDVAPMRSTFLDALGKQGLERIDPADAPFDPTLHEAVLHEDGDGGDGPVVAEVMRAGYTWKGRVLRPAMVKTRG